MLILIVWILLPLMLSKNITFEENCYLKKHCGAHFLEGPHRRVRSIGGTKAKQNEFPWVAAYYVHQIRPGFFSRKVSSRACSAVQISKRHVLTAAHCVVKLIRSCKEKGKKYSVLIPDPYENFYEIFIGSGCTNPEHCKHNRTVYSVTEVKVFEEYDPCEKKNDVALLDIVPDISPKHGSPICMTESDGILQKHLTAIGFGYDPIADYWMHGILSDLRSVNLTRVPARKPKRIAMFGHRKGVCKGDSGGPLTQLNSGNYTLQGITVGAYPQCDILIDRRTSVFADVRNYTDWICTNTGVCPIKNEDNECKKLA